jgi:hypothetical protein
VLTDYVYNDSTTDPGAIDFLDYSGPGFLTVGLAGYVLSDYTNPNSLTLGTNASWWKKCGEDFMWVNDLTHTLYQGKPLAYSCIDDNGFDHMGAYLVYYYDDMIIWGYAYKHQYDESPCVAYPLLDKILTNEIYHMMPDSACGNILTFSLVRRDYMMYAMGLLNDSSRARAAYVQDKMNASTVGYMGELQDYTNSLGDYTEIYLFQEDYWNASHVDRIAPDLTEFASPGLIQTIKTGWLNASSQINFKTPYLYHGGDRIDGHADTLSFEYYARDNILISDAGEDAGGNAPYILDQPYGMYGPHHSAISIENPLSPFSTTFYSGNDAKDPVRGHQNAGYEMTNDTYGLNSSVLRSTGSMWNITHVINGNTPASGEVTVESTIALPSTITWNRSILSPVDASQMYVVDRASGAQNWTYRSDFHLSSTGAVNYSTDYNENEYITAGEMGNVVGNIYLDGSPVLWTNKAYESDNDTGITTGLLDWYVKDRYGRDMALKLYTAPSSDVHIVKTTGRVNGAGITNIVFCPSVQFRTENVDSLYRVTLLSCNTTGEDALTPSTITVTGNGNAIRVVNNTVTEIVYTGSGTSTFANIETDADTMYASENESGIRIVSFNVSTITFDGNEIMGEEGEQEEAR